MTSSKDIQAYVLDNTVERTSVMIFQSGLQLRSKGHRRQAETDQFDGPGVRAIRKVG